MSKGISHVGMKREWLPLSQLKIVWPESQRPTIEKNIAKLEADGFDPDKLTDLVVSLPNGDGMYHVVDGGHRRIWLERLFGPNQKVPCKIVQAKSPQRAAEIWRGINGGRSQPSAIADHRVAVTAGDAVATGVHDILRKHGYEVNAGPVENGVSSIGRCNAIYKRQGAQTLDWVFGTIRAIWGSASDGTIGTLLWGFADFYEKFKGDFDQAHLVSRVQKDYTPGRMLGAARQSREVHRGNMGQNVMRVIVNCYNHKLRSNRLGEKDE